MNLNEKTWCENRKSAIAFRCDNLYGMLPDSFSSAYRGLGHETRPIPGRSGTLVTDSKACSVLSGSVYRLACESLILQLHVHVYLQLQKKYDCHFSCGFRSSSITHCTLLSETRNTKRLRYQSTFTEDILPCTVVEAE